MYIREYPAVQMRWEYLVPEEITTQQDFARLALQAVFAVIEGWCVPYSVDIALAYMDPEALFVFRDVAPEPQFIFLSAQEVPMGVGIKSSWVNAHELIVPMLTEASIQTHLDQALTELQNQQPTVTAGWVSLQFNALAVRLPPDAVSSDCPSLKVDTVGGQMVHPLIQREDGSWVAGPLRPQTLTAPIDLMVTSDLGLLELNLNLYWKVWYDPAEAGYTEVERAGARLRELGWTQPYPPVA